MRTLFDKVWEKHVIKGKIGEAQLIYIDLQLIHEVTSAQAFEGLRIAGRTVRNPNRVFGTMDHCTPTIKEERAYIKDAIAREQLEALEKNCQEFGIELAHMNDSRNGIVHIVGPEQGLTQPGKTIVCGDSHTATHGAFGAIAFGIGTSEVEHVLATQTLWQKKPKTFGIEIAGNLQQGVTAKDVILHILKVHGVAVGTGYAFEFFGETIKKMTMDERMTICNMAIEAGAKSGIIAPDETTFNYLKDRTYTPKGEDFEKAINEWKELYTDCIDAFDKYIYIDISTLTPQVTWGTNPSMGVDINGKFPEIKDSNEEKAYNYMDLKPGMIPGEIPLKHVFIGSCTNGRIQDLQEAAQIIKGRKVAENITAVVVPGSNEVKRVCEDMGIDKIFIDAGFEWREPGCSTCLGMNPDLIPAYEHVASTSNRNFEGRQGKNARTHLVSPITAALAAIYGKFVDSREEF